MSGTVPIGTSANRHVRGVRCVSHPATVEDVDEVGYLKANPDVARAGLAARTHFAHFGLREARLQFENLEQIARLREDKLRRVKFRSEPAQQRQVGEAANFLTPEQVAEFGIPETPPVSDNPYSDFILKTIEENADKLILDVGAGLRHVYYPNVVNTEIYPSLSTDVVCIGECLPFDDEQFDFAFAIAVLEHTRRPWEVAREMIRVVKTGGTLIVAYPFLQAVHGFPHHYFNATPQGNRSLFEDACDVISLEVNAYEAPIHALYWLLANWRNSLPASSAAAFSRLTIGELLETAPEQQLSRAYCRDLSAEAQMIIAAGTTLVAVKRAL